MPLILSVCNIHDKPILFVLFASFPLKKKKERGVSGAGGGINLYKQVDQPVAVRLGSCGSGLFLPFALKICLPCLSLYSKLTHRCNN